MNTPVPELSGRVDTSSKNCVLNRCRYTELVRFLTVREGQSPGVLAVSTSKCRQQRAMAVRYQNKHKLPLAARKESHTAFLTLWGVGGYMADVTLMFRSKVRAFAWPVAE